MKNILNIIIGFALFLFYSCSASTGNRYEDEEKKTEDKTVSNTDNKIKNEDVEDFDFTPYRTKLDIPEKEISIPEITSTPKSDIWYGYEDVETDTATFTSKKIIDKVQGYRVLIFSSDNLEEANNMRSEIYFNTEQKDVYVVFDPPFYKVMVGDFIDYSEAQDLSFKMNQLGYSESRVVNETVNVFE
ncbi:MAG TPA: SPOR domain-containing protein [Ignavibacteriaceae bacterium]|nr:SPOR domain-containing protein [Ignavibacteriaceae bacterium]